MLEEQTQIVYFLKKKRKKFWEAQKTATTKDVTGGITKSIELALPQNFDVKTVSCVSVGTTVFINSILERSENLAQVAVIRLCGSTCRSVFPFETFPKSLSKVINGGYHFVNGGYEYHGKVISDLDKKEIEKICHDLKKRKVSHIVVNGVFSPMNNEQELQAYSIIKGILPNASVTLTHTIAHLGLLERENAAILNEALKPIAKHTIHGFHKAFKSLKILCPFYLTQNDGTLIDSKRAMNTPIFCISSGPTNSARGAYTLTGINNAIFVDIGGTTTDVGVLANGFSRLSQHQVKVGGVQTNFRIPDVMSIGLGGGSIVTIDKKGKVSVGPKSVGYKLTSLSKVFGGDVLTATDVCVVKYGLKGIGKEEHIEKLRKELDSTLIDEVISIIHQKTKDVIDMMKANNKDVPIILVGGGVIIIDEKNSLFKSTKPKFHGCANAIGAAIAQISGEISTIIDLKKGNNDEKEDALFRKEALSKLRKECIDKAVANGADRESTKIVFENEIELGYVGLVTGKKKVTIRAIGEIKEYKKISDDEEIEKVDLKDDVKRVTKDINEKDEVDLNSDDYYKITEDYQPNIFNDEWIVNAIDLKCISIGAGILGCGGGGNTYIGELTARKQLGKMKILPWWKMNESDSALPLGFMGAPSVLIEKLPSGNEFDAGIKKMNTLLKKDITGLLCVEIGGMNGLTPLYVGGRLNLPVYDCDFMGRAFPELQMITSWIYGDNYSPVTLSDERGNVVVKEDAKSCKEIESVLRVAVFQQFGGYGGLVPPPMNKDEVKRYGVKNTYSQAFRIGRAVLSARTNNEDPVKSILRLTEGKLIFKGKIIEVNSKRIKGFDKVVLMLEGIGEEFEKSENMEIIVQNENLVAKQGGKVIACVPDLISIVSEDDGTIIETSQLQFGLRCSVLQIPIDDVLKTKRALEVVGPQAFKLENEFVNSKSIGSHKSIFKEKNNEKVEEKK